MVVWENGRMKKSDYRKFIIQHGRSATTISPPCARWSRAATRESSGGEAPMPALVLIDGGIGQLHAAAEALEAIGDHQPAAGLHRQARGDHLRLRPGGRARSCSTATRRSCT